MSLPPASFCPEGFTPVHRNSLAYLQSRVEDAERQLDLVVHALNKGYDGEGAASVLELIMGSLATLRGELQPENLYSPAAKEVSHVQ